MNIEELMEKLPEGGIQKIDGVIYFYPDNMPFSEIEKNRDKYTKQSNETFTDFIQRVVENE